MYGAGGLGIMVVIGSRTSVENYAGINGLALSRPNIM